MIDALAVLKILAPQLTYTDEDRDDGFPSRFERGWAIFQRGSLYRLDYGAGVRWSVPSWSTPRLRYTVFLDPRDGCHQCPCKDWYGQSLSCCSHIAAAAFAEVDHQQGRRDSESIEELKDLLHGALA